MDPVPIFPHGFAFQQTDDYPLNRVLVYRLDASVGSLYLYVFGIGTRPVLLSTQTIWGKNAIESENPNVVNGIPSILHYVLKSALEWRCKCIVLTENFIKDPALTWMCQSLRARKITVYVYRDDEMMRQIAMNWFVRAGMENDLWVATCLHPSYEDTMAYDVSKLAWGKETVLIEQSGGEQPKKIVLPYKGFRTWMTFFFIAKTAGEKTKNKNE